MDEVEISDSRLLITEARDHSLYPMYFGVSCALFALELLSKQESDDKGWAETRDKMLQERAHLLGVLIWRWQREESNDKGNRGLVGKLEAAEKEIEELKKRRSEDAKGNEKVASIYAAKERSWFDERKKLQQQIGRLINDLRVVRNKRDEAVSELKKKEEFVSQLNGKLQEMEVLVKSKDKVFEEEEEKMKELEEQLKTMATAVEELKENVKRDAQVHSSELWKHKTALIEMVSSQRQLEAQLGRAVRQAETAKKQLELLFKEKEESMLLAQNLSMELEKMSKDLEQKDKILSVMLRKYKLDKEEKQMLLKEVKLSKAKKKQAEIEARAISGSRNEKRTLKSVLSRPISSRLEVFPGERGRSSILIGLLNAGKTKSKGNERAFECVSTEIMKGNGGYPAESDESLSDENEELELSADAKRFDSWVWAEAARYQSDINQSHQLELEAFAEQMRLKDDKLEAYRWRLLSMEIESKRLHSQIEGLDRGMSQLRHDNIKLETLLMDREEEIKSLKDQISLYLNSLSTQKAKFNSSLHELPVADDVVWSNVKVIKKKPADKEPDTTDNLAEDEQEDNGTESVYYNTALPGRSSVEECEYIKEVASELQPLSEEMTSPKDVEMVSTKEVLPEKCMDRKDKARRKMDLHALGVSYKIKRLKQQLLMLERMKGRQEDAESGEADAQGENHTKVFHPLLALLTKQVNRYQSLQEKIDDILKRMHENELCVARGDANSTMTKEETRTLENFLEETFQLQRFVVATGQKLMEMQAKIASTFVGTTAEELAGSGSSSFDLSRFADTVRTLFGEVQRGVEVRIAQIIGDLEGTLACDGIYSRK